MNLKEYISSGIIESYVMGLATPAEMEEFESVCKQYPEIAEARDQFELQLEERLMQDAVAPPVIIKEKIWTSLNAQNVEKDNKVEVETPVRKLSVWKMLAAASVILLAGTAFWAFTLNNKYQSAKNENKSLRTELDRSTAQLNSLKTDAEMMQKPTIKMAALQGTANAPASFATVYWDTTSKDVYLLVNNLPQPTTDKQYQLWALIDNQPVDLGVIIREERLLVKMKNVQNAQAFAITLEPKGGSASPTMESMFVSGKL